MNNYLFSDDKPSKETLNINSNERTFRKFPFNTVPFKALYEQ